MPNPWIPRFDDPAVRFDTGWTYPTEAELATALIQPTTTHAMIRQAYYPSRIADQTPWLENFGAKLPGYVATLGLAQNVVDANLAGCRFLIYVLSQYLATVRAFGPATTESVDLVMTGSGPNAVVLPVFTAPVLPDGVAPVPPGVLTRLFDLIGDLKRATNYTDVIGKDLGVVAPEDATQHAAPGMKLKIEQGAACQCVRLSFFKYGHMGVYIESKRGGGPVEFLTVDTESPYVDDRALLVAGEPETRSYRMRFWDKGTPNGEWTDWTDINVGP